MRRAWSSISSMCVCGSSAAPTGRRREQRGAGAEAGRERRVREAVPAARPCRAEEGATDPRRAARPHLARADGARVTRPSLWFVTPAFRRFELSQVCFAQRAAAIKRLDELGIDASCVVVADDENLDIARSFGFAVVEVDNRWLGRRFNEGYAFAAEEGVDYIVPIGSDSWLDTEFFADGLPAGRGVLTSRLYASVDERGSRLSPLEIAASPGVGPHVVAVSLLEDTAYRPVNDNISR